MSNLHLKTQSPLQIKINKRKVSTRKFRRFMRKKNNIKNLSNDNKQAIKLLMKNIVIKKNNNFVQGLQKQNFIKNQNSKLINNKKIGSSNKILANKDNNLVNVYKKGNKGKAQAIKNLKKQTSQILLTNNKNKSKEITEFLYTADNYKIKKENLFILDTPLPLYLYSNNYKVIERNITNYKFKTTPFIIN
jgi:hypothetical protein